MGRPGPRLAARPRRAEIGYAPPVRLDRSSLPDDVRDAVQREVAPLRLLEHVVRWAFSQTPPSDVADVIVQDEFSHDVVVPWRGVHLVFDTT